MKELPGWCSSIAVIRSKRPSSRVIGFKSNPAALMRIPIYIEMEKRIEQDKNSSQSLCGGQHRHRITAFAQILCI